MAKAVERVVLRGAVCPALLGLRSRGANPFDFAVAGNIARKP